MKLAIVLAALLLVAGCRVSSAPADESTPGYTEPLADKPSGVIEEWYIAHHLEDEQSEGLTIFAARETERFAALLDLNTSHVLTMLSMWHRESGYKQIKGDDGRSYGITQSIRKQQMYWRRFWWRRHIDLPSIADPTTQVAFGVAEFYECLKMAKGDEFDAVRRYNGGGWKARRYAWHVFMSRRKIFGWEFPETKAMKAARKLDKEKKWCCPR